MFSQVVANIIGQASRRVNIENPEADRYARWLMALAQHAFSRWLSISASGLECKVRLRGQRGEIVTCGKPAISPCIICGEPCCLEHSLVSAAGPVACMGCLEAAKILRRRGGQGEWPETSWEPPSNPSSSDYGKRVRYLHILEIEDEDAGQTEIQAAYKKLVKELHPDRASDDNDRRWRTKRLIEINAAYKWLMEMEEKAA